MAGKLDSYPPAVAELLESAPLNDLGPGRPSEDKRPALEALSPETLAGSGTIRDPEMAQACLAGLWLRYDFLDQSHSISQSLESPTGSYWHGIMHRREPDFGNSKYWFRRVGRHPVFEPLCEAARQLALAADVGRPAPLLAEQAQWDPFAFVDLCQHAIDETSSLNTLCREVQKREWQLLFDYCYERAVGA